MFAYKAKAASLFDAWMVASFLKPRFSKFADHHLLPLIPAVANTAAPKAKAKKNMPNSPSSIAVVAISLKPRNRNCRNKNKQP